MKEQDPWLLETMSDGELLSTSVPFIRGCKSRASLPAARSCCQTREKPPGVLFLQYCGETKQVMIPSEISEDSLRALFVKAFPHQLNMKMLMPPNMAICIRDTKRNVYYDLEDLRYITPNSCLKAYHKDPAHVFNPYARPANSEGTISKEILYGNHSPIHRKASSSRNTLHSWQGSMSPPMVRSMPSSPSRMTYGGSGSHGKKRIADPGSSTMPRECQPGRGRSSTISSSSAILERRDVKPDANMSNSTALVLHGDRGSQHREYYRSTSVDVGGGRHSSSSYCSSPPVLTGGRVDAEVLGIPGGLQQYRASIKPLDYRESKEHHTNSVHRQNRMYGDSQIHSLRMKSPPPTPHRGNEVTFNGQVIGGANQVSPRSMSPIHHCLERNSTGLAVDVINRKGSSSSTSSVFLDSPLGQPETLFPAHITACNTQRERMKAMEEQIASLAGLVHHALSMGSDVLGQKEAISQSAEQKLLHNRLEGSSDSTIPAALTESFGPAPLALKAPRLDSGLRQNLMSVKRDICELRLQLSQLKCLQLSNLESVSSMLRMAGPELVMLMCEKLVQFEEAVYRQRAEMDEDRIHYLNSEKKILTQLSELEDYVGCLENSSSVPGHLSFTLSDVEKGAVRLQRLGEALAVLKGEFPVLQAKMHSVLRPEVEAVRFLKEEPHKMDSMLKRVKVLTETLSSLRRCLSNSIPPRTAQVEPLNVHDQARGTIQSPHSSPKPQPRYSVKAPLPRPPPSKNQGDVSSAALASPIMTRRMKSTAMSDHYNSSPLTTSQGLDSTTVAKNIQRASPEGSLCVDIRSISQSSTSQDAQLACNDPSHTQSVPGTTDCVWLLQDSPNIATKPMVNLLGKREDCCDSASGKKSPPVSTPKQNIPAELTQRGQEADCSDTKKDTSSKRSHDVYSREKRSSNTVISLGPVAIADPPPAVCPQTESSRRPQVEKPRRSSDKRQTSKSSSPPQSPHTISSVKSEEPIIILSKETDKMQVSKEILNKGHLSSGNKENPKEDGNSPPPVHVAKKCSSNITKCEQAFAPQLEHPNNSSFTPLSTVGVKELHRVKMTRPFAKITENVQLEPSLNCPSVEKVGKGETETVTVQAGEKKGILAINLPDPCKDKAAGHIFTSAEDDKLENPQKGPNQGTYQEQKNKFIKKAHPENSNVIFLQNENIPKGYRIQPSARLQQNQLLSSGQDREASPLVRNHLSCSPEVTYWLSSMQQNEEEATHVSRDQPACREGGSLKYEEPPPIYPQTPEFIQRISQMHISSQFGNEEPVNINNSGDTHIDYMFCGFKDNDESDGNPVIIFINRPEDTDPICETLSTIFECEEEEDETMAPNRSLEEEPDLKSKSPTGTDTDIIGNMKNSLQPSSFYDSVSELQGPDQTNLGTKTCSKRTFKIKFPKTKLAALSQAIRAGTNKRGKKVSIKAANDEEQKTENSLVTDANMNKLLPLDSSSDKDMTADTRLSKSHPRVEALCKHTLDSISSLEESIKQLDISVESITPSSDGAQLKGRVKINSERSPSKRPATQILKVSNPPESKRVRAQPLHSPTSTQSSSTSAQRPCNKLEPCGSPEDGAEVLEQPNKNRLPNANTRGL